MSDWTEQNQGTLRNRYEIWRACADDGHGNDIFTGKPLLTCDEWLDN